MLASIEKGLLVSAQDLAAQSAASPFDAVIVGGGTAGITAARTLHEAGCRVALLEAGPLALLNHVSSTGLRFDPTLARSVQASLQYSPHMADGTEFGALIACVGGRGMFWNGAAPRYSESDLDAWPLTREDLDPFYDWIEREFAVTTSYSTDRLASLVIDRLGAAGLVSERSPLAVDTRVMAGWLGGTVGNSLHPLLRSGALTSADRRLACAVGAFCTRVLLSPARDRATGVRLTVDPNLSLDISARSVVLAAGGLESVRLAMASEFPDASGLIGRLITDHLFCRAYYPARELFEESPEVATVIVRATASQRFQLELHLPGDNLFTLRDPAAWHPDDSRAYAVMVRSFGAMRPRVENFVELLPGEGRAHFAVHLSLGPEDAALREEMVAALEHARVAVGAQEAPVQQMPMGASHHEAGGLVMGTDPRASVTDPFGRFHRVPNVVVADASAFPAPPATNPHITIGAIARRQAQELARTLQGGP